MNWEVNLATILCESTFRGATESLFERGLHKNCETNRRFVERLGLKARFDQNAGDARSSIDCDKIVSELLVRAKTTGPHFRMLFLHATNSTQIEDSPRDGD